ncbi:hypothetical protein Ga0100231_023900 [Opitutaceae bacterium TAV4]|nr:hypothetical protein Ga0100231_023900 [Opitutaceae bacterium TAV4]RRK00756.1 hypothetical protein Ga0100230_023475 [Opitutaceae bacterium TAV3]
MSTDFRKLARQIHHLVQLGHIDEAAQILATRDMSHATPKHQYRMHPETLRAIRENALDQSCGDAEAHVMVTYTQLLELLDFYEGKQL